MRIRLPFIPVIPEAETLTGHIYSTDVLDLILRLIRARLPLTGSFGHPLDGRSRITDTSHILQNIEATQLQWFGDVEIISSHCGRLIEAFSAYGVPIYLATRLHCTISADGRVDANGLLVAGVDIVIPDQLHTSPLDIIAHSIFNPAFNG